MNSVTYKPTSDHKPTSMLAETREKFQFQGPDNLSELDLLNLVIGTDASDILDEYPSLAALAQAPWQEITLRAGIGPAKASRLQAAIALGWRLRQQNQPDRMTINSPEEAAQIFMESIGCEEQEHIQCLMLNVKNTILAPPKTIYIGNINSTVMRVAEIFRPAIRIGAAAIVLAHNHPSMSILPSPEDIHSTKKIGEAGRLLDIELLDHVVVSADRYYSMKEHGVVF